ncbi:MAG TPA: 2-dehydropantoate 2-reductase [Gemmataceae bacterium]|jgi:2-dehydropantoate 2-reductase|nr:2-dehydropantoate 2-reductase [Gemmataceae bacterium]
MRILVIGAGATGGYFGGRLLAAGRDITFLVRPERAARLAKNGLTIESRLGNVTLPSPPTVVAGELRKPFDVVLLSCKAYDLETAIGDFAPAVGSDTVVVPLLNGMRHLDVLDQRLGASHVLGGQCLISARLDGKGRILHLTDAQRISLGERAGGLSPRVEAVAAAMAGAGFESRASDKIVLDMWEKWVFLATLAGMTCLMRASVGDIVAAGGSDLASALLEECRSIAVAAGWPPRPEFMKAASERLLDPTSTMTASMLADVERGGRTEADHILGDLLRRRGQLSGVDQSLLRIAFTSIKAHEARQASSGGP